MQHFKFYNKKDLISLTNPRRFETKMGERIQCLQKGEWPNNYSFMSQHPAGAQFAYADGHVQSIPNNVDITTYRYLATISGAETASIQ